ncbi:hypothetical protein [Rhizosphaericola mali]|uniref:DUF3592 domain-containing protein n=1 Tax=Rhizosphaericola mali TaxID=2545455 RepID=A0A5P2G0B7_9BACT|nr:hypothetical protein [Rhizosphaericola mali]QES88667.1 hypothetical protein E0W69_008370 [Rhizosphaericola mali]
MLAAADPSQAILLLYISIFLWSFFAGFIIYQLLFVPILKAKNFQWLQKNGATKLASIVDVKPIGNTSSNSLDIQFCVENFSQTLIKDHIILIDDAPDAHRFDKGNTVYLKLDPNLSHPPNVIFQDSEFSNNYSKIVLRLLFSCAIIALIVYGYSVAYSYESQELGWRFLELFHPLILSPLIGVFVIGLFYFVFKKAFKLGKNVELLYKGIRCKAEVLSIHETGTKINNAYKLKYDIQFTDVNSILHRVVLSNLVSPIDMGNVRNERTIEIFYLPDNPQKAEFANVVERN